MSDFPREARSEGDNGDQDDASRAVDPGTHTANARPQSFALQGFTPPPPGLEVRGRVERSGDRLSLTYRLLDPAGLVTIPAATATPQRRDGLWEHTCLEAFLADPGAEPYWEVNLAPSGDWNVYRLSGYREGLAPERAISALPFDVSRNPDGLGLAVSLDLTALPLAGRPLELGITAVLELQDGAMLYWALCHPGAEADFHLRQGFQLLV